MKRILLSLSLILSVGCASTSKNKSHSNNGTNQAPDFQAIANFAVNQANRNAQQYQSELSRISNVYDKQTGVSLLIISHLLGSNTLYLTKEELTLTNVKPLSIEFTNNQYQIYFK